MSLIRTEHLQKTYIIGDMEVHAVHDLSLSIEQGEFVTIMGPSGSGKTSLMNILGCLDVPTSGKYFLDEKDVSRMRRDDLATIRNTKIGFIFQQYNLLTRINVMENVILPMLYNEEKRFTRAEQVKKAEKSLSIVGLTERMHFEIKQLSGGQQQRVAIARSLVNDPSLIMADEPTGALDTKTSYEVMQILQDLNEQLNISILMVTHSPEIAQFSKRIISFRDGMMLSDTPVENRIMAKDMVAQTVQAAQTAQKTGE
ncbi:MAG: ABC transporter ATP-binding protein [Vulcanimicrobiota bacterium]